MNPEAIRVKLRVDEEKYEALYWTERFFDGNAVYHHLKVGRIESVGHSPEECVRNMKRKLKKYQTGI